VQSAPAGYEDAADVVWSGLKQLLERCVPPGGKVFVTGHSPGGALAALIANRIGTELQADVDAVYTFGMPRAGSKAFADLYNRQLGMRTYRLVHGEDVVPTVAPTSFGFRHLGLVLHCERQGRFDKANLASDTSSDFPPSSAALPRTSGIIYMGRFPRCCRSRRGSNWPRRS
jgi:acetyl esterase/lipase